MQILFMIGKLELGIMQIMEEDKTNTRMLEHNDETVLLIFS